MNIAVQNIHALLFCVSQAGLPSALIRVIVTSDTVLSVRAAVLLGQFLHLVSILHYLIFALFCIFRSPHCCRTKLQPPSTACRCSRPTCLRRGCPTPLWRGRVPPQQSYTFTNFIS